jgi:hypothetical protein
MVEMVHDRIAAGETTVVSTAAVLRCGKQMENYHISTFPRQSLSKNRCNSKQLLDDLKEARRYWQLEEAQDRTLWRTQFGRGYGPVARQTTIYLVGVCELVSTGTG